MCKVYTVAYDHDEYVESVATCSSHTVAKSVVARLEREYHAITSKSMAGSLYIEEHDLLDADEARTLVN